MSILGHRAEGITFNNNNELFEVIGYLAKNNRVAYLEAEVPTDKVNLFQTAFPGQAFSEIKIDKLTSGGNKKKEGMQFRLYLNSINLSQHVIN